MWPILRLQRGYNHLLLPGLGCFVTLMYYVVFDILVLVERYEKGQIVNGTTIKRDIT